MDNRKLAKKGRYGDTHIRDVYGIKSHVNKLEADIIDSYGLLGESFVEATGSGTINPLTSLPEYHLEADEAGATGGHNRMHQTKQDNSDAAHAGSIWDESGTEYGIKSLNKADFFEADGKTPRPIHEIIDLIIKHKPFDPELMGGTAQDYRDSIRERVNKAFPKLQGIDKTEKGFLRTEKDISGQERDLDMTKATDAYGLTTRAAGRGLESSLGKIQQQASSIGGATRGVYGGMGGGMRGAIGGQQTLAKGVESTYGAYGDKMLGAEQALGYADTAGGIGEQRADLTYGRGMHELREDQASEFEGFVSSFLDEGFEQGGRVPTFSEILSKLPEAGGS